MYRKINGSPDKPEGVKKPEEVKPDFSGFV